MPDKLKPPIFLLGNVRSGTTMIQNFFAEHPDIVRWFEPRTVWVYAAPRRKHDRFDASDARPRVKRYIRKRFLKYQRMHDGRRIMEKTPSNMMRIPYVEAIFPESKYLYLVREPLAQLSSSEIEWQKPINRWKAWSRVKETPKTQLYYYAGRAFMDHFKVRVLKHRHVSVWGVRYPGIYDDLKTLTTEEVIAKQWVACSQQAEADLATIDPAKVLRMRYEDFVADPVTNFNRILEHFDLDMPRELAASVKTKTDPSRQQKWKRLDPEVLRRCLPILEDEMARHGYAIPDEARQRAGLDRG